jgi:ABC-type Na+ efflux pump permease subunit
VYFHGLPVTPPPRRPSLFGPLVWWELVRLARGGHAARARILLIYALLLAFIGFAFSWSFPRSPMPLFRGTAEPFSIATAASFAQSLALVLLEAQLVLVAAITPAYATSAVSNEKDRQTLPLLLTTDLTDREIVWGKAVGRAAFVLTAVLAGVPVLMITLLFGGVDLRFLAAGYALTVGTTILSTAIGVNAACHAPDGRTALVRAYFQSFVLVWGALIPPFVLFSPFAMLAYTRQDFGSEAITVACGFGYPVGQLVIAWVLMTGATRELRKPGPTAGPLDRTAYPEPPRGRPAPIVLTPLRADPRPLPPLDEADPVLWKERHTGRASWMHVLDAPARWLGGLFAIIAVMLFVTGGWTLVKRAVRAFDPVEAERLSRFGPGPPDSGGQLMTAAGVLAAGLYLLPLSIGVTGSVAGERHRATLDSLLTTLLPRKRLLWSKVRAHAESGLVFGVGAVTAVGCGFGADGGVRLGLAAMAATASGFALVIALGAWASVRSATPVRAFRHCLPAVVAAIGLPILMRDLVEWENVAPAVTVLTWVAGICAAAAAILWWRAGVELERGNG